MKQEIRVLQISMADSFRGSEKEILDIFRNINPKIKFDFLCTKNIYKNYEKEINQLGGIVYSLDINRNNFINKILYSKRLNRFLKENKYDYIHINTSAFFYALNVSIIAKKNGIKKVIVHSHNIPKINLFKLLLKKILNPLLMNNVDAALSCSELAKKSLFRKKDDVIILKNGIDINKFKFNNNLRIKLRKKFNLDDKVIYGHIGNFVKQKNHNYFHWW